MLLLPVFRCILNPPQNPLIELAHSLAVFPIGYEAKVLVRVLRELEEHAQAIPISDEESNFAPEYAKYTSQACAAVAAFSWSSGYLLRTCRSPAP